MCHEPAGEVKVPRPLVERRVTAIDSGGVAAHTPRNPETRERMPVTEYVEVQFPGPIVPTTG